MVKKKVRQAKTIEFVLTGGTIDAYFDGIRDAIIPNKHSQIPSFIKSLKLKEKLVFKELFMKDSRALTLKDLKKISDVIQKSGCEKIIVTHGTYTMDVTAKFVESRLKQSGKALGKTVVFTGSMIPLIGFSPSDAPFNLGFALAKVNELPCGVYVCMNGRVFSAAEAAKIVGEGRFVSVFG